MQTISLHVLLLALCLIARCSPLIEQRSVEQLPPELYPLGGTRTTCGPLPGFQIQPLAPSRRKILVKRQEALPQCFPIAYEDFTYFPDGAPSLELNSIKLTPGRNYTFSVSQSDGLFWRIIVTDVNTDRTRPPLAPKFALMDGGGVAKVEGWQVMEGVEDVVISMELKKAMLAPAISGWGIQAAVFSLKGMQDELY
ncbi:MAG: hypothetical protein Q9167_003607 [Letrouitia subvulpina]